MPFPCVEAAQLPQEELSIRGFSKLNPDSLSAWQQNLNVEVIFINF